MSKHVAHRNRDDDWLYSPKHVKAGKELAAMFDYPRRCADLPWPRDLFSQQALTIEQVMAQNGSFVANAAPIQQDMCHCNCGQKHNNGFPKTITVEEHGQRVHKVFWFRTHGHWTQWTRRQGT